MSTTDLLAFLDATDVLRRQPVPVPRWLHQRVLKEGQACCWHCEAAPGERAVYLFSPALGGDGAAANVVPACGRCALKYRHHDPLAEPWAKGLTLPAVKAARRLEALTSSAHHDVPKAATRTRATRRAWLEAHRWAEPRVAVSAMNLGDAWLVGPVAVAAGPAWAAMAQRLKRSGAQRMPDAPGVCVVAAATWYALACELIGLHAHFTEMLKGD